VLVHQSNNGERLGHLPNLSDVLLRVVVDHIDQRTLDVAAAGDEVELAVEGVRIRRVGDHDGAVGRRSLGHDEVCAGWNGRPRQPHARRQDQDGPDDRRHIVLHGKG